MRIDKAHRDALADLLQPWDTWERRERYLTGDFPRADKVNDLNTRYRWDLLWAAGGMDVLRDIPNLKDTHIETALRAVVRDL